MLVIFYGSVQNHSGCRQLEIDHVDSIEMLIDKLGEDIGEHFKEYLLGEDTCFFLVNSKSIVGTGGLKTLLSQGDKIEILPVVEAG